MSELDVVIVRTGTANLASVISGFKKIGANPKICEHPDQIESAERLVLPGVGTIEAAMDRLESDGLVEPLKARLIQGKPTFAVCLGLQLLCQGSEENPERKALGIVPGVATRFTGDLRVPQLGWNKIIPHGGCELLKEGYVYFANSFRLETPPEGWAVAIADYGGPFVAAMERGSVLACQFHPELSGKFGLGLISRWLKSSQKEKQC